MGLDNIPTRSTGQTILDDFFNVLKRVCGIDFVPRNVSGVPQANAGQLGTPTYPWERANITNGYFVCGQVMMFHDFNGALSPGQGWMKCNGDIVNEANYDAIHGAGAWDTYIVGSLLDGKYLPNMNNKFPVGATNTTQAGSSAITFEGNTSHQINIAHTHTGPSHNHKWSNEPADNGHHQTYNSSGTLVDIGTHSKSSPYKRISAVTEGTPALDAAYTNNSGTGNTGSNLSSTQSIKPESCAFEFWMRII